MIAKRNDTILHLILLTTDVIGSFLSIILAFAIRYHLFIGINKSGDSWWIAVIILLMTIIMNIFYSPVHRYTVRGIFAEFTDVLFRQILITVGTVVILYLAHTAEILSRLVFGYYIIGSIIIIWIIRLLLKSYLLKVYKTKDSVDRIILITTPDRINRLQQEFNDSMEWQRVISKTFAVDQEQYDDIIEYAVHNEVDEAFVSIPNVTNKEVYQDMISKLVGMGIKVDIDIHQFEMNVPGLKSLDEVGKNAVVSISRNSIPISKQLIKRAMDILGSLVGCLFFLIAFIIVGPLIKLDSEGPVIFVQKRVGKNGRIFDFYKFRSMYQDAEERKNALMHQNESKGLMFKMENDPRITKIGKILRKTSIDELPQFWNVLKGDMSLVGTRPPTLDEYKQYEPWHKCRLAMRPGITGLWQVSGRSDIKDFDEVVRLDMKYIDNWSIGEDIKILIKTIGTVFSGKGSK